MKTAKELREQMTRAVQTYVPQWKVVSKKDSTFHKVLSWLPPLLFFRKAYMENFWTTVGFTAASPIGYDDDWDTIAHEGKHGIQFKKWSRPLMGFLYTFPQSFLIPLVILLSVFYTPWFLLGLAVAAAPLPAPWRMLWELQAYKISVMVYEWQWAEGTEEYIDEIADNYFAGASYYYMWPFTAFIKKSLHEALGQARNWSMHPVNDPYLQDVYAVIRDGGRLAARYR